MALAESTFFSSNTKTKKHVEGLAEDFLKQWQERPGGGWHYKSGGLDFSVSGWTLLGLLMAQEGGSVIMKSRAAKSILSSYRLWVDKTMTDPQTGKGFYLPQRVKHPSMTWSGMAQKQALGFSSRDPFLVKAQESLLEFIKKGTHFRGDTPGDIYQIYFGTRSAFYQKGKVWETWNSSMKKCLLGSQKKGNASSLGGSWDPTRGHTGHKLGRVGTTALMALTLQIYFQ